MAKKTVNGDDLIYAFLQGLFESDDSELREVPVQMLMALGIWFPLEVYRELPVLLPWVVRDPTCRPTKTTPDEWSSPNEDGFLRDDNSKIKTIPKNLAVESPHLRRLHGARMGTEFVASHVWRQTQDDGPLASRRPLLNSFVPNLVWLPRQISKLTDREGSLVQRTLQSISWSVFRDAPVDPSLKSVVEEAWSLLPPPDTKLSISLTQLNTFQANDRFFRTRHARIRQVVEGLSDLSLGRELAPKQLIDRRYTEGMPGVDPERRDALRGFVSRFLLEES
jgi:hypothetical protein